MKIFKYSFLLATTLVFINSCNNQNEEKTFLSKIELLETQGVKNDSVFSLYEEFIGLYPNNANSARLTYKLAESYKMTDLSKAATLYRKYFDNYPDSSEAANSLFNAAFLLENIEPLVSIDLYKKFINTFPEDERTESAKQNLRFVGKPAEYIMDQLKKQGLLEGEIDSLKQEIAQ